MTSWFLQNPGVLTLIIVLSYGGAVFLGILVYLRGNDKNWWRDALESERAHSKAWEQLYRNERSWRESLQKTMVERYAAPIREVLPEDVLKDK